MGIQVEQAKEMLENSMLTMGQFQINAYGVAVTVIFLIIALIVWGLHRNQDSDLDLTDMITTYDPYTKRNRASTTKTLQLVGGIVASFAIVKLTLQAALTWDLFAIYLAYVASVEGFSRFLRAKYGVNDTPSAKKSDDEDLPKPPKK